MEMKRRPRRFPVKLEVNTNVSPIASPKQEIQVFENEIYSEHQMLSPIIFNDFIKKEFVCSSEPDYSEIFSEHQNSSPTEFNNYCEKDIMCSFESGYRETTPERQKLSPIKFNNCMEKEFVCSLGAGCREKNSTLTVKCKYCPRFFHTSCQNDCHLFYENDFKTVTSVVCEDCFPNLSKISLSPESPKIREKKWDSDYNLFIEEINQDTIKKEYREESSGIMMSCKFCNQIIQSDYHLFYENDDRTVTSAVCTDCLPRTVNVNSSKISIGRESSFENDNQYGGCSLGDRCRVRTLDLAVVDCELCYQFFHVECQTGCHQFYDNDGKTVLGLVCPKCLPNASHEYLSLISKIFASNDDEFSDIDTNNNNDKNKQEK